MRPYVEIFSQGEEVLNGQIADTNAAWLAQKLVAMGFIVKRHSVVGDNLADLQNLLTEISIRADCCICSGGLGPTVDDLTAQAVADAFARPLELDPIALAQIEQYFSHRHRKMVDANRKQALIPQGAERLNNEWGTAPGFALKQQRCWFFFVPGVPSEMKAMFNALIAPRLKQRFALQPDRLVTLRSVGIGESDIQDRLSTLTLPDSVQLSFRADVEEVQTKLLFPAQTAQEQIEILVQQVQEKIGHYVFAVDNLAGPQGGLVQVIDQLMQLNGYHLSVYESITQGLIAAKCIAKPWLLSSSFIKMDERMKSIKNKEDFFSHAENIAQQVQNQYSADMVLVQICQGHEQQLQQAEQPVVIYNLLLTPDSQQHSRFMLAGSTQRKQNQAAILALDLLRRYLQSR